MISLTSISRLAALVIGQQQLIPDRSENDAVEIPPSNQYVVCGADCARPTPKIKKVVIQRAPAPIAKVEQTIGREAEGKSETNEYAEIQRYLKKDMGKDGRSFIIQRNAGKTITASKEVSQEKVYFGLGSSVLTKQEQNKLSAWLGKIKATRFEVFGVTSITGTAKTNKKIAADRAEAVKKFIASKQPKAQITIPDVVYSDRESKNPAMSRRTEIKAYQIVGSAPIKNNQQSRISDKPKQDTAVKKPGKDIDIDIDEDIWEGSEKQGASGKPAAVNSRTFVPAAVKKEEKEKVQDETFANKQRVVIVPMDGSADEGKTIFLYPQKPDTKEAKK